MAWEIMKDGSVRHRDRSLLEEVDVDADGMNIRLEVGTGHERCDMSTNLPMRVLVGLFERAGYELRALPSESPEAEVARLRAALEDMAEGDCAYGDGCPTFGSRHGRCFTCRATEALNGGAS